MKTIVVIDDDAEDIDIIKESVETLGDDYRCETFLDACIALDHLRDSSTIPDLIVIDVNMSKINGQECLDAIRMIGKLSSTVLAVNSSAMVTTQSLINFEKSGAVFFQKPSTFDAMKRILQRLIANRLSA